MPQSQTAANSRHKEEKKGEKRAKQTNVREAQRPAHLP